MREGKAEGEYSIFFIHAGGSRGAKNLDTLIFLASLHFSFSSN